MIKLGAQSEFPLADLPHDYRYTIYVAKDLDEDPGIADNLQFCTGAALCLAPSYLRPHRFAYLPVRPWSKVCQNGPRI
jgi:hypothetical protein